MFHFRGLGENKLSVRPIRDQIKSTLFRVILPAILFAALLNFIYSYLQYKQITNQIFESVKSKIDVLITESAKGFKRAVLPYEKDIIALLDELYSRVERDLRLGRDYSQIDFKGVVKRYESKFPPEIFADINCYVISKDGKVIWTDYQKDLGLDLSKFEDFWKSLNVALEKGPVLHRVSIEVLTGKMRLYAYKRLSNGDILELGFFLNNEDFIKSLRKLKEISPFLENIGVYNVSHIPIISQFPQFPEKLLKIHPFKRDMVGEISFEDFPPHQLKLLVYARLNFYRIFGIVLFNIFLFLLLFVLIAVASYRLTKWAEKESGYMREAIESFKGHRKIGIDPSISRTYEVRELLNILKEAADEIKREEAENSLLLKELKEAFYDFAERLALVAEGYDIDTGEHLVRVKYLTKLLVQELEIPEDLKEEVINYSVLHDVGKIFIPLDILNKPGPLDPDEWELMKQHTVFAKRLLAHPRFKVALEIALYHHENYDGTGYPFGLAGEAIPLTGRIIKIVDVYEALRSERPYKRAFSHEETVKILLYGDNRTKPEHFDPLLLKKFIEVIEKRGLTGLF
ncbi:MAG: HD domain-containing phosphohydrolase [bacterium]|nr:HD domain-containing phosphohydrolase [bacterium]